MSEREQALLAQRRTMLDYLKLRLSLDDMHGVQDAASDVREIDARLNELRRRDGEA